MLARPRAEVEDKITERIWLGIEMHDQAKSNVRDATKFALDVQRWRNYNLDLLQDSFSDLSKRNEYYRSARESYVDTSERAITASVILDLSENIGNQLQTLKSIVDRLEFYEPMGSISAPLKNLSKVFVVHGHDEGALQAMARFLETIGLQVVILREQPDQGRATIEKFEACAAEVGFAVVLLTPDDLGGAVAAPEQAARARQNVIFELGYFVGSLGRGRACLLRKGNVEIPSDLFGVIYTDFDHPAEGSKVRLARELKAAEFEFDEPKVWA
jgi:predicted nucleotide-binding protein